MTENPSPSLDSAAARLQLRIRIADTPYRSLHRKRPMVVRWVTITYEQRAGSDVTVGGWSARLVGVWMHNDGHPSTQHAEMIVQRGFTGATADSIPDWLDALVKQFQPDLGTVMSVALGAVL